jgi:hypothetical protein
VEARRLRGGRERDLDGGDGERHEAAVAEVDQEVSSNLLGSEVIDATGTIGHIGHDDHLQEWKMETEWREGVTLV